MQKKRQTAKPRGNAAQNKSSTAGKRLERQPKAAGAGVSSKPTTAEWKRGAGQNSERTSKESNVGKVYRGKTKYIDKETKPERDYVVVVDNGKNVSVSKLKSIKIFDANGKNADKALVEINATRYGLEKRTGVDFQVFSKNRMSGKPLEIEDKDVFPEDKERFKLGSHDTNRALVHTGRVLRGKKKRGK